MSVGVAVFETLELRNGQPFALTRHLQRLRSAAVLLQLEPIDDKELLLGIEQT